MKKIILKIFVITLLLIGFTGCNDFLDVNKPSDAVDLDILEMNDIMAPIVANTAYAQYYSESIFGNYTQYFAPYGTGAAGRTKNYSTWYNIYAKVLPNIRALREKAVENGATHYEAVAKILEAMNISFAVDNWDDVPYSQAGQPLEIPFPVFDEGQEVYTMAIQLLNEAIATMEGSDPNTYSDMGSEDLFYGGDYDKWLKAAYTYKARLLLHLTKNGHASAADVLASINHGFTSNSDNMELYFVEGGTQNPYYVGNVLNSITHNHYKAPNDQIISAMNGTSYPFESGVVEIDPRLPAIYIRLETDDDDYPMYDSPIEDDTPWRGAMNGGDGESSDGEDFNTFYKDGGYHTSETAPFVIITYAEAMLIKAEAAFLANGGTTTSIGSTADAYAAYMAGIEASMNQLDVDGSDYMADAVVDVGEADLMLHHIMKEKYIANIHNPETFNDFRRYDFSADVFHDLALRLEEEGEGDYPGQWFRRAEYPTQETESNPNSTEHEEEPIVPIWWDQ